MTNIVSPLEIKIDSLYVQPEILSTADTSVNDPEELKQKTVKSDNKGHDNIIVELANIHKTYLLGIEGVAALRYF